MRYSFNFLYFLLVCSFFIFVSCGEDSSSASAGASLPKTLPQSAGQIDEIIVVMDDAYWKGDLGILVREILGSDYAGLPQSEPLFEIRYIPFDAFKNLFRRSSTVVFISPSNCGSELCAHVNEAFSHYNKQGTDFLISFRDVYATPQKIVYLSAPDVNGLSSNILSNSERILKAVYEIENDKAYRSAYAAGSSSSFSSAVAKNIFVDCKVPKSYNKVIERDSVLWFRQDLEGIVSNLVFHVKQLPSNFDTPAFDANDFILSARNEYGKKYVLSETEGSYMMVDSVFVPTFLPYVLDNKSVVESRGFWYLTQDFMGGPFLNYAYFDKANNRAIFLDAWLYAPQWEKRPSMRRLEQILRNAKFL